MMIHSWPQQWNLTQIKTCNHRNFLHCIGPGASANQLID